MDPGGLAGDYSVADPRHTDPRPHPVAGCSSSRASRDASETSSRLDGVTFSVPDGEIVGFVGPNGAGKTTTMRIALGVLAPDAGEVRWNGQLLDAEARRRFGYMPEERGLYPKMKVLEQLVYLARLHGLSRPDASRRAAETIEVLGVAERANDRVENLSLGNQQRVQLAAALVHRPDVLDPGRTVLGSRPGRRGRADGRAPSRGRRARCPRRVLQPSARPGRATLRSRGPDRSREDRRGRNDRGAPIVPRAPAAACARGGRSRRVVRRDPGRASRSRPPRTMGSCSSSTTRSMSSGCSTSPAGPATSPTSAGRGRRSRNCSEKRCGREHARDGSRGLVAGRPARLLVSPAGQGLPDLNGYHLGGAHRRHPDQRVRGWRHADVRSGAARIGVGSHRAAGRRGRRCAGI